MANDSTLKSVIKFGIVINWMQLVYVSDNTCDFVPIKISMYICICSFRSHNAHQIDEKFTKNKKKIPNEFNRIVLLSKLWKIYQLVCRSTKAIKNKHVVALNIWLPNRIWLMANRKRIKWSIWQMTFVHVRYIFFSNSWLLCVPPHP